MGSECILTGNISGKRCVRSIDWLIGELADSQHGVVARWQLRERGLSADVIEHRLATGRLRPIHRGVYAVGHLALTRRSRWMAGVLAAGPGAWLSHHSAGELRGYVDFRSGPVHVSLPRHLESRRGLRFHQASIPNDELDCRCGIPVTGPFRTVLDLAAGCTPATLDSVLAKIEADEITDNFSFATLLQRYPGRRGSRRLREAWERSQEVAGITRSPLERRFLRFLAEHNLPMPETNVRLHLDSRRVELDCLWRDYWLAAELDSWTHHKDRRSFHADRARNRSVVARAGLRLVNITDNDMKAGRQELESDMRSLLAQPATRPFRCDPLSA